MMKNKLKMIISGAIVLCGAAAASCGAKESEGLCPPPADDGAAVVFNIFTPNAEEFAPFPTDLKTVRDDTSPTGLRLSYGRTVFSAALNTLNGFGLYGGILIPVTAPVDPATLPASPEASAAARAPLFLLDLSGLDGSDARTFDERKVPVEVTSAADDSALLLHGATKHAIALRPLKPLDPGGKYGVVATSCVSGADGKPLRPADSFRRILDGEASQTQNPAAEGDLTRLVDYLGTQGYEKNDLALAATFTAQSITEDFIDGRQAVYEGAPPQPAIGDVYDATDAEGNLNPLLLARMPDVAEQLSELPVELYRFGRIGKIAFGTFTAKSFMDDQDLFVYDEGTGKVVATGTEELEFLLMLPKEDPAAGITAPFRTLVFQHALGVCKETAIALGDTLARYGIASIGVDAVTHGSRSPDGPGGCIMDDPMQFFAPENFAVTGDRFRQTVFDLMSLVRMLKEGEGIDILPYPGGDGAADLMTDKVAFAGQSMGSSIGILFLSFEPQVGSAVLSVAGGMLSAMVIQSTMGEPCQTMPFDQYNLHALSFSTVFQAIADKADPVNFARFLIDDQVQGFERPLSVLYQQATCDGAVPMEAYGMIAEQMGIPIVEPVLLDYPALPRVATPVSDNIAPGVTAGLFQFDPPAPHEMLLQCDAECIDVMFANQTQLGLFLKTWFETGQSVIVDPWNPEQVAAYE